MVDTNISRARIVYIFAMSPIQAECQAIIRGLREGLKCGPNIIVKTDCKNAVEYIKDLNSRPPEVRLLVREINTAPRLASFVLIVKVSRDVVRQAHYLAHKARTDNFYL